MCEGHLHLVYTFEVDAILGMFGGVVGLEGHLHPGGTLALVNHTILPHLQQSVQLHCDWKEWVRLPNFLC